MASSSSSSLTLLILTTALLFLVFASPTAAFGAGNIASISKIEGVNFRHGDIEDVLLTLYMARAAGGRKFSKMDVMHVYFGNWLRDYSQAVDVGTVKHVSAEAVRILIWILGFLTFGYGVDEFEVTTDRLGCYQPTEHIDNPLGYADGADARRYDRRLRGPVDKRRELSVDERTGLKHYIATEDIGIDTSAGLVRKVFGGCIKLGRQYARSGNKADLYEALRLLGTGLHCLEDYAAHSNYTELSLIEMGERDVFPHVGRNTMIQLPGCRHDVYPIVTGTFGGVDFLHSVMGEFSDKATQSEIQCLEGAMEETQNQGNAKSFLQELLAKIPSGIIGGNESGKMDEFQSNAQAQAQQENITPHEPEEWTRYLQDVTRQIYPVLEWHDNILKSINKAVENIPVLPELIEQIQEQINVFVFSVLAPYVLPIINQVKAELETGSSEIIQSSKREQLNIFNDDDATDPTHSMLSKDHFSNLLNEPAGKIAQEVVKWVVPQIMECWDDENVDVSRTLNRIITGVFHHPAHRDFGDDGAADVRRMMFGAVEEWWQEKGDDGVRRQLSREGVRKGENHKSGIHDCGHGSGVPLKLSKKSHGHGASGGYGRGRQANELSKLAEEAVGGGAIGGLVGGLAGALGQALGEDNSRKDHGRQDYDSHGGHHQKHDQPTYHQSSGYQQPSRYEQQGAGRYEQGGYQYGGGHQQSGYEQSGYEGRQSDYGQSGRYDQPSETRYGQGYGSGGNTRRGDYDEQRTYEARHDQSSRPGGLASEYYEAQEYSGSSSRYGGRESKYSQREHDYSSSRYDDQDSRVSQREHRYSSGRYEEQSRYARRDNHEYGRGSRNYESSHYGTDERRRSSRERDHGRDDRYERRYKKDSDDDDDDDDEEDDDERRRRHHKHHGRRRS
ncbi:NIMA-interacting protein TinC [Trichophyton violaceum]|uniref:NIMA-interacting protein TinC n=1 Tax=Trichophyton violaceum TaxID=34388 RepID=A0A178FEZ4_TRIVO|nr:NIMA-interacting protein TinC [Trichophyton violaceum]